MTQVVEDHLKFTLECVLVKTKRLDLLHVLYTILKELVINGCKANQKRIFFDERGLNLTNPTDYKLGMQKYKAAFSESMAVEYGLKARLKGVYVLIDFRFNEDGLTMEVVNNTPIAPVEEKNLREKLKRAMTYQSLAEFYMDQTNIESEGAGLGLALTLMLLRGEGIDPKYFRVIVKEECTVVRLEVPFTDNFTSKRDVA